MRAREGDLIKAKSGVVFDVKGLVHPAGKIVAFPRFIPSPQGTRQGKEGTTYGKVYSLGDRFKYLQENYPDLIVFDPVFGETMCEVPEAEVAVHFKPEEKLWSLRSAKGLTVLESKALQLAETLKAEANIPWSSLGISGSIMAGLTTEKSDIDPLVYGVENCRKAYAALQRLLNEDSGFKPYSNAELRELFDFRSKDTQMTFDDFVLVESRKAFQGKFMGADYFIRFVKDWSENGEHYGDVCYKNSGYAKVTAKIADAADSLFTPCTYKLVDVRVVEGPKLAPIAEVVSFRGRFCEQAENGEAVEAQGKVELVTNVKTETQYYRLILGNKPSDYMVLSRV